MSESDRLDEFDKVEWWDVCRKLKPKLTWEEYEVLWVKMLTERERFYHNRTLH